MKRSLRKMLVILFAFSLLPVVGWAEDRKAENPPNQIASVHIEQDDPALETGSDSELFNLSASMAVQQGLAYLNGVQNRDGSFGNYYRVAETSLAGMAFLANGNGQGRGLHAKAMRRCVDYLLRVQDERGYFTDDGYSRMHGHGYALLFLSQVYGMNSMSPGERAGMNNDYQNKLKDSVDRAVNLCILTQTDLGGWNYDPKVNSTFDEASITVCIVQGLRAARDAGVKVSKDTIDQAVEYIERSYDNGGSFLYSLRQNIRRPSFALTAAGLSALVATGEKQSKHELLIHECLSNMQKYRPDQPVQRVEYYYYYAHFYAAQAMYQLGGQDWTDWYKAVRNDMVQKMVSHNMGETGFWTSNIDSIYGTAMAVLVLEVPNGYLPLFQK